MSQQWIIQENLINSKDLQNLKTACIQNNIPYTLIKQIPFSEEISQFPKDEGKHIYYGSTTFITNLYKQRRPRGIFFNENCNMQILNMYWKEKMLNYDCMTGPLEYFCKRNEPKNSKWFVRPNYDSKLFPGQIISFEELQDWNNKIEESTALRFDDILFSSPKHINKEWRLIIVNRKVITSCLYRENFEMKISRDDQPSDLWKFAEDCWASGMIYTPHDIFVMDVGLIETNGYPEYKVIECNCFNMSGFYDCDLNIIVKEVSEYIRNLPERKPHCCSRIRKMQEVRDVWKKGFEKRRKQIEKSEK